ELTTTADRQLHLTSPLRSLLRCWERVVWGAGDRIDPRRVGRLLSPSVGIRRGRGQDALDAGGHGRYGRPPMIPAVTDDWLAGEEGAFFRAVIEAPDDDPPRLVYADWLDDRAWPGDVARAEFIRLSVRLSRTEGLPPEERATLARRESDLLQSHREKWLQHLPLYIDEAVFVRGFVERIRINRPQDHVARREF